MGEGHREPGRCGSRHRFDPVQEWVERSIFWQVWERVLENEFVDRSVALAAKAFVSLFPALIVVAAFAPHARAQLDPQTITHRAGLSGSGLATVKGAFKSSDDVRKATGIVGLLFTFFYVNSFTSALGRVYTRAWRRPPGGRASGYAVGAAWLIGVVAYFAILGAMRSILHGGPETALFAIVALLASIGLWWLTPWLMLQRQVRWRPLLTGAVLTGVGMSVYAATRVVVDAAHRLGEPEPVRLLRCRARARHLAERRGHDHRRRARASRRCWPRTTGWIGRLARGSDVAPSC